MKVRLPIVVVLLLTTAVAWAGSAGERPGEASSETALTAEHGARFADDFVEVYPARVARRWFTPFALGDRDDFATLQVISGLGAYRASYVKGHKHSGADLVPRGHKGKHVDVYPLAWGAVCSVHLGAPHATVVLKHRLPNGELLYTSYKHLAAIDVELGQQVAPDTKLGRLYTRAEARVQGGNYDHLHLELRNDVDDFGAGSWTTMSETALRARFRDPVDFLRRHLGRADPRDSFSAYLEPDVEPSDGFDPPAPAAERSGGRGPQVRSLGKGRVLYVAELGAGRGQLVVVQHVYYENHRRRAVQAVYRGLTAVRVEAGGLLERGAAIGRLGPPGAEQASVALDLELRRELSLPLSRIAAAAARQGGGGEAALEPSAFVAERRALFLPGRESALLLIDADRHRMRFVVDGETKGRYPVAFGQARGRKRVRGDLKTPRGLYYVVEKSRGPFRGDYAAYYGGHWIKINYPNAFDAAHGVERGLISEAQAEAIAAAWRRRALTWQGSKLGSGIGLHGWAGAWDPQQERQLSWGCVVMDNDDIKSLFGQVPLGAAVVIF